jgi:hypothetical protein
MTNGPGERRAELGVDISLGSLLVIDLDDKRVPKEAFIEHLRFARIVRVSTEGNASLCRGLLAARYGSRGATHDDSREEAAL